MKVLVLVIVSVFFMNLTIAHEGGHGELKEGGSFGGITSPVVDQTNAGKVTEDNILYKAELVRAESGKISLYLFDKSMKLLNLDTFSESVEAKLEVKKKGKFQYVGEFKLTKHGNHFMGQLPTIDSKPFNIDLFFSKGSEKLFIGFSNLD